MDNLKIVVDTYDNKSNKDSAISDSPTITGFLHEQFGEQIKLETQSISKTQHKISTLVIYQDEKYISILRVYMSDLIQDRFELKELKKEIFKLVSNNDRVYLFIEIDEGELYQEDVIVLLKTIALKRLSFPIEHRPSFNINHTYNFLTFLKSLIDKLLTIDIDDLYRITHPTEVFDSNPTIDFYMKADGIGYDLGKKIYKRYPSVKDLFAIKNGDIVIRKDWYKDIRGIGKDKKQKFEKLLLGEIGKKQRDLKDFS